MIAAPLVGLVGALLLPQYTGGLDEELANISAHIERWLAGNFLVILSFFLMAPAVLGVLHLLRERSVALGHVGAALALLGIFFHGAIIGYSLVEAPLVESEFEKERVVEFTTRMYESPAFIMILAPFVGVSLGMTILAVALWRANVVPVWISALIVMALLSEFVGTDALSPELLYAFLLVGLRWLGLKVLRTPDAQWSGPSRAAPEAGRMVGEPAPAS